MKVAERNIRGFAVLLLVLTMIIAGVYTGMSIQAAAKKKPALNVGKSCSLLIGKKKSMKVKNKPAGAVLKWSTSNKKKATVSKKGVVKGKTKGTVTITCKVSAKKKSYTLKTRVAVSNPKGIKISKKRSMLMIGESYQLKASFSSQKSKDPVKWTTSNKSIIKMNKNGKMRGVKPGTVTVTAETESGEDVSIKVQVVDKTNKVVTTFEEMKAAAANTSIETIIVEGDITISGGISYPWYNYKLIVCLDQDLTVSENTRVYFDSIINNGAIQLKKESKCYFNQLINNCIMVCGVSSWTGSEEAEIINTRLGRIVFYELPNELERMKSARLMGHITGSGYIDKYGMVVARIDSESDLEHALKMNTSILELKVYKSLNLSKSYNLSSTKYRQVCLKLVGDAKLLGKDRVTLTFCESALSADQGLNFYSSQNNVIRQCIFPKKSAFAWKTDKWVMTSGSAFNMDISFHPNRIPMVIGDVVIPVLENKGNVDTKDFVWRQRGGSIINIEDGAITAKEAGQVSISFSPNYYEGVLAYNGITDYSEIAGANLWINIYKPVNVFTIAQLKNEEMNWQDNKVVSLSNDLKVTEKLPECFGIAVPKGKTLTIGSGQKVECFNLINHGNIVIEEGATLEVTYSNIDGNISGEGKLITNVFGKQALKEYLNVGLGQWR